MLWRRRNATSPRSIVSTAEAEHNGGKARASEDWKSERASEDWKSESPMTEGAYGTGESFGIPVATGNGEGLYGYRRRPLRLPKAGRMECEVYVSLPECCNGGLV
jgi:hypothetical protein